MIDSNNKLKSLSRALLESAQSILTEKKTVKKDLAKLAPPYDKVTHGDVLVGRKVFTHDEVKAHKAKKGIKEDADMVVIHAPVLGDINGELAEVLKRDPRDKTVHVQYEGMKYVLKAGQYEELDEAVKNPYAVGMAAAMKSTGDTPPLKKSTITKAHEIAKKIDEEVEDLDESAKIVAHLIKRYGDNVSKSHVKSAASDFGVDASKLAKAVRTKLGKTSLAEEEQIDELSKDTMLKYLSANKKSDAKAQEAGDYSKSVKRMRGTDLAVRKYTAKPGSKSVRVPANEEVELDELSHDTLRSYRMKAKSIADHGGEQRTKGRDLASRKSYGGRMAGIPKAKVMASEEVQIDEDGPSYKEELPHILKDIRGKRKSHSDMRREYGLNWKRLANATSAEHGSDYNRSHLLSVGKKHMEEQVQIDELSSDTVKSYADKAMGDAVQKTQAQQKKKYASDIKADQKGIDKRVRGLTMAKKKMANEEVENLDEISADMAHRYLKGKRERDYDISPDGTSSKLKKPQTFDKMNKDVKSSMRALRTIEKAKKANEDVELSQEDVQIDEASVADVAKTAHLHVRAGKHDDIHTAIKAAVNTHFPASSHSNVTRKKVAAQALSKIQSANAPKMRKEDVELTQEEIDFIESTLSDLEEGRGRPPKEGSAAHKAKMQQDLADMPALGVQIRKAASINKPVTFMDGKSKQISDNHINRFHDHMDSRKTSQDKSAFQKRAHKSHDEFVKAVSEPVPGRSKDTGEIVKYR